MIHLQASYHTCPKAISAHLQKENVCETVNTRIGFYSATLAVTCPNGKPLGSQWLANPWAKGIAEASNRPTSAAEHGKAEVHLLRKQLAKLRGLLRICSPWTENASSCKRNWKPLKKISETRGTRFSKNMLLKPGLGLFCPFSFAPLCSSFRVYPEEVCLRDLVSQHLGSHLEHRNRQRSN